MSCWTQDLGDNSLHSHNLLSQHHTSSQYYGYRGNNRKVVNYRQVEKRILDEILGAEVYDTRLRPPGRNKSVTATLVYVNIFVRDFSAISDVTMVSRTVCNS